MAAWLLALLLLSLAHSQLGTEHAWVAPGKVYSLAVLIKKGCFGYPETLILDLCSAASRRVVIGSLVARCVYLLQKLQCLFCFDSSMFLCCAFQNVSGIRAAVSDGHTQYLPLGSHI